MRTTITLSEDVAVAVEQLRRERGAGISEVVNELVRRGLQARDAAPPFVQRRSRMGVPTVSLDDVAGLLDSVEGDERRS